MLTELGEGVWWFECTGVNAYLVADDDGLTLVDAGTPFDAVTVELAIESTGFDRADLERILVTHYDFDHVGATAKLDVDAPVYVGRDDADLVTGERKPPLSGAKPLLQRVTGPLIPKVATERVRPVDDGDEIGGFTAYHTPGHTPGHVVYVHEELGAAFLGDMVVERDGHLHASPWYISYDTARVAESIADFDARAPDFDIAGVGHGTPYQRHGRRHLSEVARSG